MKKLLLYFILFCCLITQALAQDRTVRGKISDAKTGMSLPGVSVFVKGSTIGTVSDAEGNYQLNIPPNAILVFQSVGLKTKEIPSGNLASIDISLEEDTKELGEIVITGYKEESREKFTGSVASVQKKDIEQVPMPGIDQILQGRATGLWVSAGSGQPGSSNVNVLIRGASSINGGTNPLYIMDGVPIDANRFASINFNDVESVNVLKDASATSIYGSRAANGVIVITTKKGKVGKTQMSYRFQYGLNVRTNAKFDMMNTAEKIEFERYLYSRGVVKGAVGQLLRATDLGQISPAQRDAEINRLSAISTDWSDVFFRTGRQQSHEINATGGSEKTQFFVSANYFNQEGIGKRSELDRYTLRFNLNHNATEKFTFGMNTSIGYSKSDFIDSENSINIYNPFAAVFLYNPYERPINPQTGEYEITQAGNNVEQETALGINRRHEIQALGNGFLQYEIIDGLTAKTSLGINFRTRNFDFLIHPATVSGQQQPGPPDPVTGQPVGQGTLQYTNTNTVQFIGTTTLQYQKTFAEKHSINVVLGNEWIDRKEKDFNYAAYGINPKLLNTPAAITPGSESAPWFIPAVGGSRTMNRLVSFFADANYTFNSRYNLSLGVRRDGSSRFGQNVRFANFYAVGASWNISEEGFFTNLRNIFDQLKIRTSYGTQGNQEEIGNFAYLPVYGVIGSAYNGRPGIAAGNVGNPNYKWEVIESLNVGVDFKVWKSRISGSIDYYNRKTTDLFLDTQLSLTTGFGSLSKNVGTMRNRGIEVALNADVLRSGDFAWNLNVNYTHNWNKILDLFQEDEFELGTSIIREGLPLGSHYAVKWAGVNPANGEALYYDKNGNITNVFSENNSLADFGTSIAPEFGGFTNSFSFKGLELSVFCSFARGHKLFNNQTFFQENPNFAQFNVSRKMLNIWKEEGQRTDIQGLNSAVQFSSKFIEDASYLRIRNVTLAYNLPARLMQKVKLSGVRVYLQGQNLFTLTKYTGFDPEESGNLRSYAYPVPRIYTMGIDVNF